MNIWRPIHRLIERPPALFRRLLPGALYRGNPVERKVYLTFDDGPIPEVTPWVLDVLDRYGAKATFFMVGDNVRKYPEIYRKVLNRGHSVGNHTMHHLNGLRELSQIYIDDVAEASAYVDSGLFRPPHGWLKRRQAREIAKGKRIVMYDLVTRDYSRHLTAADVARNVRELTRNGSIIVFHDSLKSWERLERALPESLEWLKQQGYEFGKL